MFGSSSDRRSACFDVLIAVTARCGSSVAPSMASTARRLNKGVFTLSGMTFYHSVLEIQTESLESANIGCAPLKIADDRLCCVRVRSQY
jgi:hypothetical protein